MVSAKKVAVEVRDEAARDIHCRPPSGRGRSGRRIVRKKKIVFALTRGKRTVFLARGSSWGLKMGNYSRLRHHR